MAFDDGLMIETCGPGDRVLKLLPPLTITEADLARGLDILETAVAAVATGVRDAAPHHRRVRRLTAFLDGSDEARRALEAALALAAEVVAGEWTGRPGPYSGASPAALERLLDTDMGPATGVGLDAALRDVGERIVRNSIDVAHPRCAAHLHCPPLIAGVAAEAVIAATNQSLDSWDQSPGGHAPRAAAGALARGGLQPRRRLRRDLHQRRDAVEPDGPAAGPRPCGGRARPLGHRRRPARRGGRASGSSAPTRRTSRCCSRPASSASATWPSSRYLAALTARSAPRRPTRSSTRLAGDGLIPIAVVGTAGTTDLGALDPLAELADVAARHDAWFHVDAAVGGALITSERERGRLAGLELADSIAVDFHKLWFQPISCGAFLVRDADELKRVLLHADYLNPEAQEDGTAFPNLVDKSLQTTRRFDALKLFVSLQAHGTAFFGRAVEATIDLAAEAARLVEAEPALELAAPPGLNTVLFRHAAPAAERDALNMGIRRDLLLAGDAVVAQTRLAGETWLKLTLMNPQATAADVGEILALVLAAGRARA